MSAKALGIVVSFCSLHFGAKCGLAMQCCAACNDKFIGSQLLLNSTVPHVHFPLYFFLSL